MSEHAAGKPERIALLGGTFDPPHNGHLALARAVCGALALDTLLLVPAGNPHFKLDQQVTPVKERVEMTQLLAAEDPRLQVSTIEAQREGVTYSADTLEELKRRRPDASLLFVIGGDCVEHVWRWRRARDIAKLCTLVAVARPGYDMAAAQEALAASGMGFSLQVVRADTPNISSTQVRKKAAAGQSLQGLVPTNVERYIRKHGTYRC